MVIELLADSTAQIDRTDKKSLYPNGFQTPEYFWFSPVTGEFAGFRLTEGQYATIAPDKRGGRHHDDGAFRMAGVRGNRSARRHERPFVTPIPYRNVG